MTDAELKVLVRLAREVHQGGRTRHARPGDLVVEISKFEIDPERRTDPGDGSPATSPKSNATRVVPLTPDAVRCLRARLDTERARLGKRWSPDTAVWPSPLDHASTISTVACQAAMDRYTRRAKLEDVSWHTLRHTFASWLVMRGVPLRAVQELLGHHDMKMTMRYAHLAPGFAHHAAVAALDVPLVQPEQLVPMLPAPKRKR